MSRKIFIAIVILGILAFGIWLWLKLTPKSNENKSATQNQTVALAEPILSIRAFNQTSNIEATKTQARAGDILAFILTAENPSAETISGYAVKINIADLVANSTLVDSGGAAYNSTERVLSWTPLDIPANQSIQQRFTARVNPLANNAQDSIISLTYNNNVQIGVTGKVAGAATSSSNSANPNYAAPVTGVNENLTLLLALATTVFWFFRRKMGITF